MNRYIYILLLCFFFGQSLFAQKDSTQTAKKTEKKETLLQKIKKLTAGQNLKAWNVNNDFATEREHVIDTLGTNFHLNTTPVYQKTIAAEWLGNMGLPSQSAILKDRHQTELINDFIFRNPYLSMYQGPNEAIFYNTKIPYSNLSYYNGYKTNRNEEHLGAKFAINANHRLNFAMNMDYIYGRGAYYNQSSDDIYGYINGSYRGEKYATYFIAGLNNFQSFENGGIIDDRAIASMTESENVPVNLNNAWSVYNSFYLWNNHQYHIGYDKLDENDSEKVIFVPVMTLGYTIKYENSQKKYLEKSGNPNFYPVNYYADNRTRDTISNHFIQNILSVTMNEGFQKWAVFGVRAFAEVDWEENMCLRDDSLYNYQDQVSIAVGGELFKRKGNTNYGAMAKVLLLGSKNRLGFDVKGDFSTKIHTKDTTLSIGADGYAKCVTPSYFTEHYYSNHFQWDNTFNNSYYFGAFGTIKYPNQYCNIKLTAGWQGIKNYIYFNKEALPEQNNDAFIQVIHADAAVHLKAWLLHLDAQVAFQYSSHQDIMPLPMVSLYGNFYFQHRFFKKLLMVQLGVDCRYNTAYYANNYMPATGQFYLQDDILVGNYPLMNVYLNLHLKQFRFFVMYYNLSQVFIKDGYFTTPHYPLNPGMLKLGLSWNFYD